MSGFLGPLDAEGRLPAHQQTHVGAFLVSAHGALARQHAFALTMALDPVALTELNTQLYREAEIVSLLLRATRWTPVPTLGLLIAAWEAAWLPRPAEGVADQRLALAIGSAALAHAVHAGIRPAALLPAEVAANDPFAMALHRVEFESGRLLQGQILFLKSASVAPYRDNVSALLDRRHAEVRRLWRAMLGAIGVSLPDANDENP